MAMALEVAEGTLRQGQQLSGGKFKKNISLQRPQKETHLINILTSVQETDGKVLLFRVAE